MRVLPDSLNIHITSLLFLTTLPQFINPHYQPILPGDFATVGYVQLVLVPIETTLLQRSTTVGYIKPVTALVSISVKVGYLQGKHTSEVTLSHTPATASW